MINRVKSLSDENHDSSTLCLLNSIVLYRYWLSKFLSVYPSQISATIEKLGYI